MRNLLEGVVEVLLRNRGEVGVQEECARGWGCAVDGVTGRAGRAGACEVESTALASSSAFTFRPRRSGGRSLGGRPLGGRPLGGGWPGATRADNSTTSSAPVTSQRKYLQASLTKIPLNKISK